MKIGIPVILLLSFFYSAVLFAQGTNCSNAINIPLDGSCNNYNVSSTSGLSVHCSGSGYGGMGRVTYFRFTTNNTPDCVSLDMLTSVAGTSIEAVLYSGCTGSSPTGGNAYQSICMNDGNGMWGTNLWYSNLLPNTTYYLRVRTGTGFMGSLQMCGKFDVPSNNLCSGSTNIDTLVTPNQNNTCNVGSTEVPPSSLCAGTLENTAWYSYTVLTTGASSVVISQLNCDNANFSGNNDYGFQIGFFTGTCGSLSLLNCVAETGVYGGTVIATAPTLAAGTVVYVAIDGFAGSNCKYTINAVNAIPLAVKLKYFEGWKGEQFNYLSWVSFSETNNNYFEIERSDDGRRFIPLNRKEGKLKSENEIYYSYRDDQPLQTGYYRLKMVDVSGNSTYSRVIKIVREVLISFKAVFQNPVQDQLKLNIETSVSGSVQMYIMDVSGRAVYSESLYCRKGNNKFLINLGNYHSGTYYLVIIKDETRKSYPFTLL